MAKFLTTAGTSFYIEEIINEAENNLTLITPYLSLSNNLFERLVDADSRGVVINLVYGKSELSVNEKRKLDSLNQINIFYHENLHAKCYFNENRMIIT